jgi:LysM repeat protein
MGAVLAVDAIEGRNLARVRGARTRDHLRLVPALPQEAPRARPARVARPATGQLVRTLPRPVPGRGAGRASHARSVAGVRTGALHLTRMGRLAVTLLVMGVLAGAVALALAPGSGAAGAVSATQNVIVVQPGQTLSGLAQAYLPHRGLIDGVSAIQLANGLSSDRVLAGQRLVIPAR